MYGKEMKKIRIELGFTQTTVSKGTGIPQNTISWIESDKGLANIQQCVQLADFYKVSLDELIGRNSAGAPKYNISTINNNGNINMN